MLRFPSANLGIAEITIAILPLSGSKGGLEAYVQLFPPPSTLGINKAAPGANDWPLDYLK